jgi:hypothetical protein
MKVKTFNLLYGMMFVVLGTLLTNCVDDNKDTEAPHMEVSPTTLNFGLDGQPLEGNRNSFDIKSNRPWRVSFTADQDGDKPDEWITLSQEFGSGDATVEVSVPASKNFKSAKVNVEFSNKVGVLKKEVVQINVGAETPVQPTVAIYNETFGSASVASPWPFVDTYTDFQKSGTGAESVSYEGQTATIRNSGKASTGAYTNASGPNKLFFGKLPASFTVKQITLSPEQQNLKLTFGVNRYDGNAKDNTFDVSKLTVALSADGTNWTELKYGRNDGDTKDPFWVYAYADFTLKSVPANLYIRYTANEASVISVDDITLTTGVGGTEVDLGAVTPPEDPTTTAISIPDLVSKMTDGTSGVPVDANYIIKGIICGDPAGLNYSFGTLYLMTKGSSAAGNALSLYNTAIPATNYKIGQEIEVTLKKESAKIYKRYGVPQVEGYAAEDIKVLSEGNTVTPVTVTLDRLIDFVCMPVTIENVTIPAAGQWKDGDAVKNHTFNVAGTDFTVNINKAATPFLNQTFSAGTGSLSGIATIYQNAGQLAPRNLDDVKAFSSSTPVFAALTPDSHTFPAEGGTFDFTATGNNLEGATFTASGLSGLLSATVSGSTITVKAEANTTNEVITQTLVVSMGSTNKTAVIKIAAAGTGGGSDTKGNYMSQDFVKTGTANGSVEYQYSDLVTGGLDDVWYLKLGTSSKAGTWTTSALGVTGDKKLSFYGVAWKAKTGSIYIKVNGGGSINGANSVALTANDGATGNHPFTITFNDDTDYYTFELTGLTAASTLSISTDPNFADSADKNSGRAIMCGFQLY